VRTAEIVRSYPHDPGAFTQGLLYHDGFLYESTGGWGTSSLRQVELETGRVVRRKDLPAEHFGEGLTLWGERLVQLTWTSGIAFVHDLRTFGDIGSFSYDGQGWGLTHDGRHLLMSDGSSSLRRLDPLTGLEVGRTEVRDGATAVSMLNELEYVDGLLWANVFTEDVIARVDPASGRVVSWIDFSGMFAAHKRVSSEAVLNGIAMDRDAGRVFVTGKLWDRVYEVRLPV
jgi:glutamine cyclotransferase